MIVLLETVHPDAEAILRAEDDVILAPNPTTLPAVPRDEITALVTRGLGRITSATIDTLPALRVVARCGAGLDNVDTAAAHGRGVTVVYAPGITTGAVAEHALMLALCLARQTALLAASTARGDWGIRDGFLSRELRGRRAGIVGLGSIGSRVAELSAAIGMEVVGWTRHPRSNSSISQVAFGELLATSDVIQLCVALTPDTARLIDAAALAAMQPGTLLVNTARGQLVDQAALAAALERGHLGGYATDVWDPEPPPEGTALLADPRVLVTPHVAAFTDATYRELCVGPAEAIAAVLRGDPPPPRFVLEPPRT